MEDRKRVSESQNISNSAFPLPLGVLSVLSAKSSSLLKIRSRAKIAKLTDRLTSDPTSDF